MSRRLTLIAITVAVVTLAAAACGSTTAPRDEGAVPTAVIVDDGASASTPVPEEPTATPPPAPQPGDPTPTPEAVDPTPPAPDVTPTPEPEPTTRTVNLYFFRPAQSANLTDPFIAPVAREIDGSQAVGAATLQALLAGPTPAEQAAGFASNIPADTLLLGLDIADGLATVDLSGNYESGGGTLSMTARLAEVVFTLTQFPTVDEVAFRLDGQPVTVFSGEGLVLDGPVRRDDYRGIMPGIFVDGPAWGASVSTPIRLFGEGAVFEAEFQVELLLDDGTRLTDPALVMTDNGTGWGRFDAAISLPDGLSAPSGLVLRVFAHSAEDGSEIDVLEVPVTVS